MKPLITLFVCLCETSLLLNSLSFTQTTSQWGPDLCERWVMQTSRR